MLALAVVSETVSSGTGSNERITEASRRVATRTNRSARMCLAYLKSGDTTYAFFADFDARQGPLSIHARGGAVGVVAEDRDGIAHCIRAAHVGVAGDPRKCGPGRGARSGGLFRAACAGTRSAVPAPGRGSGRYAGAHPIGADRDLVNNSCGPWAHGAGNVAGPLSIRASRGGAPEKRGSAFDWLSELLHEAAVAAEDCRDVQIVVELRRWRR